MNQVARKIVPEVRKPSFQLENLEKYYMNNNPVSTHFLNSLHLIFPDGEKYFIRSVRAYADKIQDPVLKERVKGFISQEAQHMSAHKKVWEKIQQTSPIAKDFLSFYNYTCYEILEPLTRNTIGDSLPLAITAALEHYTAVIAEVALSDDGKILSEINKEMKELLYWHAAEEIEHKSVAYDVYEEMVGNYPIRIAGMIYATVVLSFYTFLGQGMLLAFDGDIKWGNVLDSIIKFGNKAQPLFKNIFDNLSGYFAIDFHPDKIENFHLAEDYLDRFKKEV